MSDKPDTLLPPIETCRIKTGRVRTGLSQSEIARMRDDIEGQYGTRNFREGQRRIFVIQQWKAEREADNEHDRY